MQGTAILQALRSLNPTCSMSSLCTASSMTQRSSTLEPSPHFTVLVPIFLDLHLDFVGFRLFFSLVYYLTELRRHGK